MNTIRHVLWIFLAFGSSFIFSWIIQANIHYMFIGYGIIFFVVAVIRLKYEKNQSGISYLILATIIPWSIVLSGSLWSEGEINIFTAPVWLIISVSHLMCYVVMKMPEFKARCFGVGYIIILCLLGVYGYPVWGSYYYTHIRENLHAALLNTSISQEVVLEDEHGGVFNMNDLKGKIVVMDFWSTSCGLCFKAFPHLESFYNEMKNDPDMFVVAVNLPLEGEHRDQIQRTNGFEKYKFPKLYARNPEAWNQLGVRGVPLVLVLDRQGKIRYAGGLNILWYHVFDNTYSLIKEMKTETY